MKNCLISHHVLDCRNLIDNFLQFSNHTHTHIAMLRKKQFVPSTHNSWKKKGFFHSKKKKPPLKNSSLLRYIKVEEISFFQKKTHNVTKISSFCNNLIQLLQKKWFLTIWKQQAKKEKNLQEKTHILSVSVAL